jgi:hypothetical protein
MMTERTKIIGYIGVDAGLCLIGDPCYFIGPDSQVGKKLHGGKLDDWETFLGNYIKHDNANAWKVEDRGEASLGMVVTTGYGDGIYPVKARFNSEGRVKAVTIEFIPPRRK